MRGRLTILAGAIATGFMASPASAYMVYVSNEKDNTVSVIDGTNARRRRTAEVRRRRASSSPV